MFVQVIQGRVNDEAGLKKQFDRWVSDLAAGAKGWFGGTAGVAADGEFVGIVRFESEDAARGNSDRPEQGEWWNETAAAFDGDVTFHDCQEVDTVLGGGSNDAGFVQVIQGRVKDQQRVRAMMSEFEDRLRERRPDLLGMVGAWHGDGGFTQAAYFRSEEEARANEKATEQDEGREEFMSLLEGQPSFLDLRQPEFD